MTEHNWPEIVAHLERLRILNEMSKRPTASCPCKYCQEYREMQALLESMR